MDGEELQKRIDALGEAERRHQEALGKITGYFRRGENPPAELTRVCDDLEEKALEMRLEVKELIQCLREQS